MMGPDFFTYVVSALFLVIASSTTALAQQYAGSSFTNSLPAVSGAEITFWNILDTSSQNTSLLTYNNLGTNGKRLSPSKVQKALIVIHGLNQDPNDYMTSAISALSMATASNSAINQDTVAIVAPLFANDAQENYAFPYSTSAGSTSKALVWSGSTWASGAVNEFPSSQTTVSGYAVLDQMLKYYGNSALFPNLKSIVIVGHSLGGQMTNRYAAVGNDLGLSVPIRYWIGNPDSWLWFDSSRPVYRNPAATCATYNAWRNGVASNLPSNYNTALTSSGASAILANYQSKSKIYARGTLDLGDDSSTCSPFTTGETRDERFFAQIAAYPLSSPNNIDYIAAGHDQTAMFTSTAGLTRLFYDNFSGDGSRTADMGDRLQAGDSPDPSSSNAAPPAIVGTGASGMTFQGCWTDVNATGVPHSLRYTGTVSGSLTVESCTAACHKAGYAVAGMLAGSTCLCDSALQYESLQVVNRACLTACPGNSAEYCGDTSRVSVWSSGTPPQFGIDATSASTSTAATSTSKTSTSTTTSISSTSKTSTTTTSTSKASSTSTSTSKASSASTSTAKTSTTTTTSSAALSTAASKLVQKSGTYTFTGCYSDSTSNRVLTTVKTGGSVDICAAACAGYAYFGVEYGDECYCGQTLGSSAVLEASSACDMVCADDSTQLCGNGNRIAVYKSSTTSTSTSSTSTKTTATTTSSSAKTTTTSSTKTTSTTSSAKTTTTSSAKSSTSSTTKTTSSTAAAATLSSQYTTLGCYKDSSSVRTLNAASYTSSSNTPAVCASFCSGKGYRYSGTENGNLCFCSNYILNPGAAAGSGQTGCTTACPGGTGQTCGGTNRISIVQDKKWQQTLFTVQSIGKWVYQDCVVDTVSPRSLGTTLQSGSTNTVATCLAECKAKGLTYCGVEYSGECFGATSLPSTLTSATNAGSSDPIARGCNMPCSGNSTLACGGSSLLDLYKYDSSRTSTGTVLQSS